MEINGKFCDICFWMNFVEFVMLWCIDCFDDLCEKCVSSYYVNCLFMEYCVMLLDDS